MTKITTLLASLTLMLAGLAGCAGFGGTHDQYDWHNFMGPDAYNDHMDRILAREALERLSVITAPLSSTTNTGTTNTPKAGNITVGYKGIVSNDTRETHNIRCKGPMSPSWLVAPGQQIEAGLTPGVYRCNITAAGTTVAQTSFTVNNNVKNHKGTEVHWYLNVTPKRRG